MKNIFKAMAFLLITVWFVSCHEITTEDVTRITYYPSITILGDELAIIIKGTAYTDAGCTVDLNGKDVTDQVITVSNVNPNAVGMYSVTYTAVNEDGFSVSARRDVFVVNPNSFASVYWGESMYGVRHYYDAPILIKERSDGTYLIDDLAGGFYFWGRYPGYEDAGYDFHLEAILKLEADNTITLVKLGSWYWNSTAMSMTSGTFDPDTQTIKFNLVFGGSPMQVILTGVQ